MNPSNQNQAPDTQGFHYSYTSTDRDEIKKIRAKYLSETEDAFEALRRLDASVTNRARAVSITVGVCGTLIMGGGMSLCLMGGERWFFPGVILGVVGIALLAPAYAIYRYVLRRERERVAPEILRLSEELMK